MIDYSLTTACQSDRYGHILSLLELLLRSPLAHSALIHLFLIPFLLLAAFQLQALHSPFYFSLINQTSNLLYHTHSLTSFSSRPCPLSPPSFVAGHNVRVLPTHSLLLRPFLSRPWPRATTIVHCWHFHVSVFPDGRCAVYASSPCAVPACCQCYWSRVNDCRLFLIARRLCHHLAP